MVEDGGADALTMRNLAAQLGVTTTTIYWHVGNRDDLVIALIQRLAERQAEVTVHGSTPLERVGSAARNLFHTALAHRNVTSLASQVGATTLLELPLEVTLVAELEAAGVTGADARDALRVILNLIAGFLVAAWRSEDRIPDALRRAALWAEVDDARVSAATLAAVAQRGDLHSLFDRTIRAVIEEFVNSDAATRGAR